MRKGGNRGTDRISAAAIDAYVRSCFARKVTPRVSELALELALPRSTLIRGFKRVLGKPPSEYLREQQLGCAKRLLRRG